MKKYKIVKVIYKLYACWCFMEEYFRLYQEYPACIRLPLGIKSPYGQRGGEVPFAIGLDSQGNPRYSLQEFSCRPMPMDNGSPNIEAMLAEIILVKLYTSVTPEQAKEANPRLYQKLSHDISRMLEEKKPNGDSYTITSPR